MLVEYAGRKTVTTLDIVYALRQMGDPLYGFGLVPAAADTKSRAEYMRNRKEKLKAAYERQQRDARMRDGVRRMQRGY